MNSQNLGEDLKTIDQGWAQLEGAPLRMAKCMEHQAIEMARISAKLDTVCDKLESLAGNVGALNATIRACSVAISEEVRAGK